MDYKVGDEVRVTRVYDSDEDNGVKLGDVLTISEFYDNGFYVEENCGWYLFKQIEPAGVNVTIDTNKLVNTFTETVTIAIDEYNKLIESKSELDYLYEHDLVKEEENINVCN